MKVCIYGAGAIGGYLGALLAGTDCELTLIARGPHLAAMQAKGLTLIEESGERTVKVRATDDPRQAGPQDYVILALKAHSVAPILGQLAPLLGPDTAVVTAQNGILWWYFHGLEGPYAGRRLESADPGGRIWAALGPERAIGCVVYPSCEIVSPGTAWITVPTVCTSRPGRSRGVNRAIASRPTCGASNGAAAAGSTTRTPSAGTLTR